MLGLLLQGLTVSEIALRRHRSIKTVSTQKVAVLRKLGLRSDVEIYAARTDGIAVTRPAPLRRRLLSIGLLALLLLPAASAEDIRSPRWLPGSSVRVATAPRCVRCRRR